MTGPSQYPSSQFAPYPPRRSRAVLPWVITGVVVVIAAITGILLLTLGGHDHGDTVGQPPVGAAANSNIPDGPMAESESSSDTSEPQKTARSLGISAHAGDIDGVLNMACASKPDCLRQLHPNATDAQIEAAKDKVRQSMGKLAELNLATIAPPNNGPKPSIKEVRYLTPGMQDGEYGSLLFVEFEGGWLYYQAP